MTMSFFRIQGRTQGDGPKIYIDESVEDVRASMRHCAVRSATHQIFFMFRRRIDSRSILVSGCALNLLRTIQRRKATSRAISYWLTIWIKVAVEKSVQYMGHDIGSWNLSALACKQWGTARRDKRLVPGSRRIEAPLCPD